MYDVTDRVIIPADRTAIYRAIVDEMDGRTSWWRPAHGGELREGGSFAEVGARMDMTVMAAHGRWPVRFVTETIEVVEDELIRVSYCGGAFRGVGTWRFEDADGGTRLSYRWNVRPAGVLRALAPFLPVARDHSASMELGFGRLAALFDPTRGVVPD